MSSSTIVVVGAGVIGLTTAIRLIEAGYHVVIVAKDLPGDALNPMYASTAAGAHHLSFAADDDALQRKVDKRTFDVMWDQIHNPAPGEEAEGAALRKLTQVEFYAEPGEKHIQFFEQLPDFKVLDPTSNSNWKVSFTSLTMDTTPYLQALVARFRALRGELVRKSVASLKEAVDFVFTLSSLHPNAVEAVINCTGLGSIYLEDVKDTTMYPVRGHVVVLDAPWINEGRTRQVGSLAAAESAGSKGGEGGSRTYIIPRKSGQVIIGGTREVNDWSETPDPATALDIKKRALDLFPELSPRYAAANPVPPSPEDLDPIVLADVVGFRPARQDGLRLNQGEDMVLHSSRSVKVFHNYGHSGAGWQASWGCAEEVVALVKGNS